MDPIKTRVSRSAYGKIGINRIELYDSTLGKPTLTLGEPPDQITVSGEDDLRALADAIYQFLGTSYVVTSAGE